MGPDVDHQGIAGTGAVPIPPPELNRGQPAYPSHIDPLGGGAELAGLVRPQVLPPQGAGELFFVRDRKKAPLEQAVPDPQPGGQFPGQLHDLRVGLPQGVFQKTQLHHVLALPVIGEQREAVDQVYGVCALLDAQNLLTGGGQGPVCPDGVREAVEVGDIQPPFPRVVCHIELEHGPHPASMPRGRGCPAARRPSFHLSSPPSRLASSRE